MSALMLKEILTEKKITGKELAEKIGLTETSISRIVKGEQYPRIETLLNIAQVLDVDVKDLFISTKEPDTETIFVQRGDSFVPIGKIKKEDF